VHICVVAEAWRAHPLAWIHRAEAASIAAELRGAGHAVTLTRYRRPGAFPPGRPLLRLSDPVMLEATRALSGEAVPYIGPEAAALERCYDKYAATRLAAEHGIDCPATALANEAAPPRHPLILKPRRGSDSIGVRLLARGAVPRRCATSEYLVQEYVRGFDVTVALLGGRVGMPLRVMLREGQPYSFLRKYLLRPRQEALGDAKLATRVRDLAAKIARAFNAEWAVRVDFILESGSGRLCFLECDAAPLVGSRSAFAASLAAAGCGRPEQLALLLG
jgi:D-alanine-D-alanine ligase-like ATP-grasp enzyme